MMSKPSEQLVGRNAIDGLLLGVNAERRSEANAIAEQCGYDVTQPHPFYAVGVAVCLSRRLGEWLYPGLPEDAAQRELGRACSRGYGDTIPGAMAMSHTLLLKIGDALRFAMTIAQREMPAITYHVAPTGERRYLITLDNFSLHPQFMAGALLYNLEANGAQHPACTVTVRDELQYEYELSWA